jgi:hypothetical protein
MRYYVYWTKGIDGQPCIQDYAGVGCRPINEAYKHLEYYKQLYPLSDGYVKEKEQ